jgi:hypothetical protein
VKPLLAAGALTAAVGLYALAQWAPTLGGGGAGAPVAATAQAPARPSPVPELEASLAAARGGLTYLRQAAKTGEPAALQEAERDILMPLLDALEACKVDGRVDRARYTRVTETVAEVQGLFKDLPYHLEVQPGDGLPGFRLSLRRSPYPAIQARPRPLGWKAELVGDGVILRP